jgi:hypothetical protein
MCYVFTKFSNPTLSCYLHYYPNTETYADYMTSTGL